MADRNKDRLAPQRARRRNEARPDWEQNLDMSKEAEEVKKPTIGNIEEWSNDPGAFDLENIDDKHREEQTPAATPPNQPKKQRNNTVLGIIENVSKEEKIIDEAAEKGLKPSNAEDSIEELSVNKGEIWEPEPNKWELI